MDKRSEVVRLSSALAARVRYAQMVGGPILPAQIEALLDAAKLLQACDVPWPPLVEQVLHDVAKELESPARTLDVEPGG